MNIKRTNSNSLNLLANFGAQASFSSVNDKITFGDNYSQTMIKGINALTMTLNVSFTNLTEDESHNAISFLQSRFDYEVQNYSTDGYFTNKRVEPINFQPPFPYKNNQFICGQFSHQQQSFDVNTISATLTCAAPSILDSVESSVGHNPNINCDISTNAIDASSGNQSVEISPSDNNCVLKKGNIIYSESDYRTLQVQQSSSISESDTQSISVKAPFGFPAGSVTSQHSNLRHSIFIDEPNDCSFYPHPPKHINGNLNARIFDFRASKSLSISNTPKVKQSGIIDYYNKFNKYGFNANLNNLQLEFNGRSDLEAKRILLFLESHLGYKKFCFHAQSKYRGTQESDSPPAKGGLSFFYCPEWTHTYNYINNHSISATFIECLSI